MFNRSHVMGKLPLHSSYAVQFSQIQTIKIIQLIVLSTFLYCSLLNTIPYTSSKIASSLSKLYTKPNTTLAITIYNVQQREMQRIWLTIFTPHKIPQLKSIEKWKTNSHRTPVIQCHKLIGVFHNLNIAMQKIYSYNM